MQERNAIGIDPDAQGFVCAYVKRSEARAATNGYMATDSDLKSFLKWVQGEGDVLIVTKPDRLARSTFDLLNIVERLERKKVGLTVLSMGGQRVETRTPTGKLMLTMLGAIAAFERDLMLERQREGIAAAKAAGRYKGRAPTAQRKSADVIRLRAAEVRPTEIATRLGISRASVYRILGDATDINGV